MTAADTASPAVPAPTAGQDTLAQREVSAIGKQIFRLRTDREPRLTQRQLAARAGVGIDVIRRLEQGRKRSARIPTLAKIAEALGVDLARLSSEPASAPREEPLHAAGAGDLPPKRAGVNGAAIVPGPEFVLPDETRRVVLHWTGPKAYALRIAMRMSVREFSAKLGISHSVVGQWRHGGRLRYETHRILDTMLSVATDEDLLRFDLALQELGEDI